MKEISNIISQIQVITITNIIVDVVSLQLHCYMLYVLHYYKSTTNFVLLWHPVLCFMLFMHCKKKKEDKYTYIKFSDYDMLITA